MWVAPSSLRNVPTEGYDFNEFISTLCSGLIGPAKSQFVAFLDCVPGSPENNNIGSVEQNIMFRKITSQIEIYPDYTPTLSRSDFDKNVSKIDLEKQQYVAV